MAPLFSIYFVGPLLFRNPVAYVRLEPVDALKLRAAEPKDIIPITELALDVFGEPEDDDNFINIVTNSLLRTQVEKGYQARLNLCAESRGLDHNVLVLVDNEKTSQYNGLCGMIELSMQPDGATAPAIPTPLNEKKRNSQRLQPYISNLVVSPLLRRKGFAQRLVMASENRAVAWGYDEVTLHVDMEEVAATRLYEKLGYQKVNDQAAWQKWLSGVRLRYMRKTLGNQRDRNKLANEFEKRNFFL